MEKLDAVKERLDRKLPCYLMSTQLIEAGVDIDFPFVLRDLGPFEAIRREAVDVEVILPHGKGNVVQKDVRANQRLTLTV